MRADEIERILKRRTRKKSKFAVTTSYPTLHEPSSQFSPQLRTIKDYYAGGYWKVHYDQFKMKNQLVTAGEPITPKEFFEVITDLESKRIALVGGAGYGKTCELEKLAQKLLVISELKQHQINIVHTINFKDICSKTSTTLQDILFEGDIPDEDDRKLLLHRIAENQSRLIILLDGLDIASFDTKTEYPKASYWEEASTETLMYNLMSGNIFPDVKVVISSREHAISNLPKEARPEYVVALTGFKEEHAKNLFLDFVQDDYLSWESIKLSLGNLLSMLVIPIYLIFTALIYSDSKKMNKQFPTFVSGFLAKIIGILPTNKHMHDNMISILQKLEKVAYYGTKDKIMSFGAIFLEKQGLFANEVSDLMFKVPHENMVIHILLEKDFLYFFCHQSMEEFLAACYIAKMSLNDFKLFTEHEFKKEFYHWSGVIQCLSGIIFNPEIELHKGINEIQRKQEMLRDALRERMQYSADAALCLVLHESNEDFLIRQLERIEISRSTLQNPCSTQVVLSLMTRADSIESISLPWCKITGQQMRVVAVNATDAQWLSFKLGSTASKKSPTKLIKQMSFKTWKSNEATHRILLEFLKDTVVEDAVVDYACYSGISINQVRWWYNVKNLKIEHIRWTIDRSNENIYGFLTKILQKHSAKEVFVKHDHDSLKSIAQVRKWRKVENLEIKFGPHGNFVSLSRAETAGQGLSRNVLTSVMLEIREPNDGLYKFLPEIFRNTYAEEMVIYHPQGHVMLDSQVTRLLLIQSVEIKILNIERYHMLRQNGGIPSTATLQLLGKVAKQWKVKYLQLLCSNLKKSDVSAIRKGCGNHPVEIIDQEEYLRRLKVSSPK